MHTAIANRRVFATAAVMLLLGGGHACADDRDVAAQFYPEELAQFSAAHPSLNETPETAVLRVDLDGTGRTDYLVAVYANGFEGRLQLIRSQGNDAHVVAAPDDPVLFDRHPNIEALDLTADGRPEIVVSLTSGRGRSLGRRAWIYRWDGTTLTWLEPHASDSARDVTEELRDPTFLDVDGDGDREVLEPSPTFGVPIEFATPEEAEAAPLLVPDGSYRVWQVSATGLDRSETEAAYFGVFTRKSGKARVESRTFKASQGEYLVRVWISSASTGVEASEIRLNGETIVKPNAFRSGQTRIRKTVTLMSANTLSVELHGSPGGEISVIVEQPRRAQ